jgi:methylase of polypeptide subunit release factors
MGDEHQQDARGARTSQAYWDRKWEMATSERRRGRRQCLPAPQRLLLRAVEASLAGHEVRSAIELGGARGARLLAFAKRYSARATCLDWSAQGLETAE